MGVDLTLMPLIAPKYWAAHTCIDLARSNDLWSKIQEIPSTPAAKPLTCYRARSEDGGTCYGDITETPYGEPITFVAAGELKKLRGHDDVIHNWMNEAAWAYLHHLPNHWPVVLYWH